MAQGANTTYHLFLRVYKRCQFRGVRELVPFTVRRLSATLGLAAIFLIAAFPVLRARTRISNRRRRLAALPIYSRSY